MLRLIGVVQQHSPTAGTVCALRHRRPATPSLPALPAAAQRSTGVQKCLYCPVGSVAKDASDATGQEASISCDPWCDRRAGLG